MDGLIDRERDTWRVGSSLGGSYILAKRVFFQLEVQRGSARHFCEALHNESACLLVCVCIYVCIYACMYVYVRVCTYVCVRIYLYQVCAGLSGGKAHQVRDTKGAGKSQKVLETVGRNSQKSALIVIS